jgi:hypothetical protein
MEVHKAFMLLYIDMIIPVLILANVDILALLAYCWC